MKRVIAVVAMLSAGSLLADGDDGANTYGLMTVSSSDQRTIVAIPWIQASLTNGEITVADVVRTANLAEGDSIHYYNGTNFESWVLNASTQWVAAVQVNGSGANNGTDADKRVLTRGNALVLMRTNSASRASCFYLWGQVATSTPTSAISRVSNAMVYNLIAPPMAPATGMVDINDGDSTTGITWEGVQTGDRIYFQTSSNRIECKYVNNEWKNYATTNTVTIGGRTIYYYGWTNAAPVTAGTGFWYVATNGTATTKVIWTGAPKVN